MAKYYFHVQDQDSVTLDEDGMDIATRVRVREQVAAIAGEILESELHAGRTEVVFQVRVEDDQATRVVTLEVRATIAPDPLITAAARAPDGDSAG